MNNDEIRNSKCGDVFGQKNLWDTPYSVGLRHTSHCTLTLTLALCSSLTRVFVFVHGLSTINKTRKQYQIPASDKTKQSNIQDKTRTADSSRQDNVNIRIDSRQDNIEHQTRHELRRVAVTIKK
jgi:hypothetical protein